MTVAQRRRPRPDTAVEHIQLVESVTAHNYDPLPIVVADARRAWVTDVDGHRYLDCLAGYAALNFGHGHPGLLQAVRSSLSGPR